MRQNSNKTLHHLRTCNVLLLFCFLFLFGCGKGFPPFPEKIAFMYEVDADNNVCARYRIISKKPWKIVFDADLPMTSCNGVAGLSAGDFQELVYWKKKVEDFADKNKGCFK